MTTMSALVGEQPQPKYLPVVHLKPDNVVLAFTKTTQEQYEHLKIVLAKKGFSVFREV
jgi:hypothetical protein